MDLMPTIDKYIMTSIKVNELEDLIVDTERQIVKTTVKRGIAYSNGQVKTMDSLDENLSSYKKTKEEAYKKLNDAARVQEQTRNDRKIDNYFDHVSNDSKKDLACEIILEHGDKEFCDTKSREEKEKMVLVFEKAN